MICTVTGRRAMCASAIAMVFGLNTWGCGSPVGTGGGPGALPNTGGWDAGAGQDVHSAQDAAPSCQNPCEADSTVCTSAGLIRTCVQGPTGCWHLSDPSACPSNQICAGTTCAKSCTDDCAAGAKRCSGGGAQTCENSSDGCAHWGQSQICTGGTVCKSGTCSACSGHSDCDDLSVCHTGKCLSASGLEYKFTFISAALPAVDGNGDHWDGFGGAPDAKMRLFKGDTLICTTSVAQDTFAPVWKESCKTKVTVSDKINFTMVENDAFSDDIMGGHTFKDTITMLKSGGGTADLGDSISVKWHVAPL